MRKRDPEQIDWHGFVFFPQTGILRNEARQEQALRRKTADVLALLMRRSGSVVAKTELLDEVWRGRTVEEQAVFQAISEIRRAFAPLNPIQTYYGQGYCLTLPRRKHEDIAPPAPTRRFAFVARAAAVLGASLVSVSSVSETMQLDTIVQTGRVAEPEALVSALDRFVGPRAADARRQVSAAEIFLYFGDFTHAEKSGLLSYRTAGANLRSRARAAVVLGKVALHREDVRSARAYTNVAVGAASRLGARDLLAAALALRGELSESRGRMRAALADYRMSADLYGPICGHSAKQIAARMLRIKRRLS